MLETVLLYLTPVLCRVALHASDDEVGFPSYARIAWSLLPLLVVLPSLWLPKWIPDERWEHVMRHAMYAMAFTVSAASSVRWDVLWPALWDDDVDNHWAPPLVAYLVIGTLTLWWFCLSHILENKRLVPLYTHQGDVTVLPLTLVAIATFANDVPDEVFQFSRSIIYYVPVVVAWATLFFIAFNGFATSTTTTYYAPGFLFLASAALVVAMAHLALLEVQAPSLLFQFFPPVAALLCQMTPRPTEPPVLRPGAWFGSTMVAGSLAGLGVGLALLRRFALVLALGCGMGGCVIATAAVRPVAGHGWPVPRPCMRASFRRACCCEGTTPYGPWTWWPWWRSSTLRSCSWTPSHRPCTTRGCQRRLPPTSTRRRSGMRPGGPPPSSSATWSRGPSLSAPKPTTRPPSTASLTAWIPTARPPLSGSGGWRAPTPFPWTSSASTASSGPRMARRRPSGMSGTPPAAPPSPDGFCMPPLASVSRA